MNKCLTSHFTIKNKNRLIFTKLSLRNAVVQEICQCNRGDTKMQRFLPTPSQMRDACHCMQSLSLSSWSSKQRFSFLSPWHKVTFDYLCHQPATGRCTVVATHCSVGKAFSSLPSAVWQPYLLVIRSISEGSRLREVDLWPIETAGGRDEHVSTLCTHVELYLLAHEMTTSMLMHYPRTQTHKASKNTWQ